ncbi:murein L,D-transpeptidase [Methylobacterium sp. R2-1]|uniref:L,D-transpeptidase family protein n=1 Tax=Methylobacterium sp. R2-1 TaxID=2587064 RepID=UPI00161ED45F|nr:L,D-transpeptidase family protein [Methylobacterium sp. R2-1]MBB2960038.1 murein L,D-transpeptidase YcbB/YkuD [Methylobacterium sp. R2-1]
MRAASGAGTGVARTLSVALAALLAFGHAPARAEEPAAESGIVIRKAAVDPADGPALSPETSDDTPSAAEAPAAPKEPTPAPTAVGPPAPVTPSEPLPGAVYARLNDNAPLLQRLTGKDREAIQAFYALGNFKPIWIENGAFNAAANAAIARLRAAGEDGLDPNAYPVPAVGKLSRPDTDAEIAEADLKLSAALALYARDARGGRVNPATISKLITPTLDLPPADTVLTRLAAAGAQAGDVLQSYNPRQPGYLALKERLAGLRVGRTQGAPSVKLPDGPVLKLGMSDPRVPLLRSRFGLETRSAGTLDSAPGQSNAYDRSVADAVKDFQRSRGLPASGTLTRATVAALANPNVPKTSANEADILVNMERWRWLPSELGPDYVFVNVPEFKLKVFRGGTQRDETRVIVGKPTSPTPIFSGMMEYAVVNPSWYVPPSILKQMLASGRTAGFEVVRRGNTISLRQPPGERNALGFVKFMFPNQHAVYLHDTPNRSLFSASTRAFSHGCVRVDDPFRFADAVLPNWTEERLKKLIGKGERTLRLPEKLPVHLAYFTAEVDDLGSYRTLTDLYGYDGPMKVALGLAARSDAVAKGPAATKAKAADARAVPRQAATREAVRSERRAGTRRTPDMFGDPWAGQTYEAPQRSFW